MTIKTRYVRDLMLEKHLPLTKVAEQVGIKKESLATILRTGTCSPITAGRLARVLGIEVWELIA